MEAVECIRKNTFGMRFVLLKRKGKELQKTCTLMSVYYTEGM